MKDKMPHIIPACSFNAEVEGRIMSVLSVISSISITTIITTTTIITPLGL